MSKSPDRLTRIALRQRFRAKGDLVFGLLYVGAGIGNLAMLFSL